jgi:hypothetical protein
MTAAILVRPGRIFLRPLALMQTPPMTYGIRQNSLCARTGDSLSFTSDGARMPPNDALPGVLPAINFGQRWTGVRPRPLPAALPMAGMASVALAESAPLSSNLPVPATAEHPRSMETFAQGYAYILYRTELSGPVVVRLATRGSSGPSALVAASCRDGRYILCRRLVRTS